MTHSVQWELLHDERLCEGWCGKKHKEADLLIRWAGKSMWLCPECNSRFMAENPVRVDSPSSGEDVTKSR